jgi:16S rRNA (cytidine1402-2'-O)-methyltransferase
MENDGGLKKKTGKLYLIPTPIGEGDVYDTQSLANREVIRSLDCFVVENPRSARRFLSAAGIGRPIDSLRLTELNEHTPAGEVEALLKPLSEGTDVGILSEAGVPAVADPGADLVAAAHRRGIEVVPLVGPCSILLAVMGSGLNGQSFAFNGYLPVKQPERTKAIRFFEARALREGQSQFFIEAPYRNAKLLDDLLAACAPDTRLCIAADLSQPGQLLKTRPVSAWKNQKPDLQKHPALFGIGR